METGDLSEWYADQAARPEAEQYSGAGACTVSTVVAHTGSRSALCTAFGPGDATRLFRFAEPRSGLPLVYTAWFYLPRHVTIGPGGNWNIFQFKSKHFPMDRSDPFLSFNLQDHPDGSYTVYVFKKPENVSIHATEDVRIRPRQWFGIEALLVQSGSGGGRLVVWILRDDRAPTKIIDRRRLTTRYPDDVGAQDWSVDNYGAELSPLPVELYIDDASIRSVP